MKKMLSLILIVVMTFACVGGTAAGLEGPASLEAKVSLNTDVLVKAVAGDNTIPEDTATSLKAISDILDVLTLKGVVNNDAFELGLFAGEDAVVTLGVKAAEEGITLVSSMINGIAINISKETMEQMTAASAQNASNIDMQAAAEELKNLDKEQIKKDSEELEENLKKAFEAKKGETETGEFVVDEMTFTGKTPVDMTYTELMELILTNVKDLLAKESFQPIIKAFGQQMDLNAEIDKALEKLQNQAEEEKPEMKITLYTDADQCEYAVIEMIKTTAATEETPAKEEKAYVGFGNVEKLNKAHINAQTAEMTMDIVVNEKEDGSSDVKTVVTSDNASSETVATTDAAGNMDLVSNIKSKDAEIKIHMTVEAAEGERKNFAMDVFYGEEAQALLTINGTAGKGGEMVSAFEGDGITVIPVEKLMDSSDTSALTQIQTALMSGIMNCFTVLTKNLPAESAAWLTKMFMSIGK